ncbi:MAG: hypothetical protein ABIP49_01670, partial [Lysobacterales bacterium]
EFARYLKFGYDSNFWLTSLAVADTAFGPAVATTVYGYDLDGLLVDATTNGVAMTLSRHAGNGLLTGSTLGVTADAWTRNAFSEPSGYAMAVGTSPLFVLGFERDRLGRITRQTQTLAGASSAFEYAYDLAGRLDTVRRDQVLVADYDYDVNSNRTRAVYAAPLLGQQTGCAPPAGPGGVVIDALIDAQDRLTRYGQCDFTYSANERTVPERTVPGPLPARSRSAAPPMGCGV